MKFNIAIARSTKYLQPTVKRSSPLVIKVEIVYHNKTTKCSVSAEVPSAPPRPSILFPHKVSEGNTTEECV